VESLALFRSVQETGDEHVTALASLGRLLIRRGDLETARRLHRETLERWEELGSEAGIGRALSNLGAVEFAAGNLSAANGHYARSLSRCRAAGEQVGSGHCL